MSMNDKSGMSIEDLVIEESLSVPWVVVLPDGKLSILCKRCGISCAPNLPMSALSYGKLVEDFCECHSDCKESDRV